MGARAQYDAGVIGGGFSQAHATVGESVGLIADLPPAAEVIARMGTGAADALRGAIAA